MYFSPSLAAEMTAVVGNTPASVDSEAATTKPIVSDVSGSISGFTQSCVVAPSPAAASALIALHDQPVTPGANPSNTNP